MRFNMKNGVALQKKLSEPAVDFPRVNESYTGRFTFTLYSICVNKVLFFGLSTFYCFIIYMWC